MLCITCRFSVQPYSVNIALLAAVNKVVLSLLCIKAVAQDAWGACRLQHVATRIYSRVRPTMEQRPGPTTMWSGLTRWMMRSETTPRFHPPPRTQLPMHPAMQLPALIEE